MYKSVTWNTSTRIALGDILLTLLAAVISGLSVFGLSFSWGVHSELIFSMTGIWFTCALLRRPAFPALFGWVEWGMVGLVIYTASIGYLFGTSTIGNRSLSLGLMFAFHFIYKYFRSFGLDRSSTIIVKCMCLFIVLTYWITFVELLANPWIARQIKTGGELTQEIRKAGVGGYEFIYAIVLAAPILMYSFLYGYRLELSRFLRVLAGIGAVAIVILVFLSQYLTAIVLIATAIGLLCMLAPKKMSSRIGLLALTGLMLCYCESWVPSITSIAREAGWSNQTTDRTDRAIESFGASESRGVLDDRLDSWRVSWMGLSNSPFCGELLVSMYSSEDWSIDDLGQHSQLLDVAALYGAPIGALQLLVLVGPFVGRKRCERGLIALNVSIGTVFITLMAVNNQTPSLGFVVFLVFPLFYDWAAARNGHGSFFESLSMRCQRWVRTNPVASSQVRGFN